MTVGLGYICLHWRWLIRSPVSGTFLHMLVVSVRTALLAVYPDSALWEWTDIHRTTALIAALTTIGFFLRVRKGEL